MQKFDPTAAQRRHEQERQDIIADSRAGEWRRIRRVLAIAFGLLGTLALAALVVSIIVLLTRPDAGIYQIGIPALVLGAVIPPLAGAASPVGRRPQPGVDPEGSRFVYLSLLLPTLLGVSFGAALLLLPRVVSVVHPVSFSTAPSRGFLLCFLVGLVVSARWLSRSVRTSSALVTER